MGILFFVIGIFILMGCLQMTAIGLFGLALISVFLLLSMTIGKVVLRLQALDLCSR
jgi:hypothetical protein